MRPPKVRKRLWLTVALIAVILILFLGFVDLNQVLNLLRGTDWALGLAASGMLLAGLAIYALRWRLLLADKVAFRSTFHAANVGHMTNILIPMRAGEAARIWLLGRNQAVTLPEVTSSVVVERWLEQLMRLTALAGAILLGVGLHASPGVILSALLFLGISMGGMMAVVRFRSAVLARGPRWLARLPRVSEATVSRHLSAFLDGLAGVASTRRLALALAGSTLAWSCFFGFHFLALAAVPVGLAPQQFASIALGALALAPPSAPTQPGIYHASVVAPLSVIGFDLESLTAYAVVLHALQTFWMLGFGLFGLGRAGTSYAQLLAE